MRHVYLYYRIDPAQLHLATARIDVLLDMMASHCAAPPRRLTRCDDPLTWMEIYEGIADYAAFSDALETALLGLGCDAFTLGKRHLECFVVPDPAP